MHGLTGRLLSAALPAAAVLVALGVALTDMVPPAVVPADAPPASFSAVRAYRHVEEIARVPRPVGSPGAAAARRYLVTELTALGLSPELQQVTVEDYYGTGGPQTAVNVVARIPGTASAGAIALVAHYDTVPESRGANDDAVGVAIVLETARALLAGPPLRNDVMLLLTDGEEPPPRFGSTAFLSAHPDAGSVAVVINFEALGTAGVSLLSEVAGPEGRLMSIYAESVPHPAASSVIDDLGELLGGSNTDVAPFRDRDVAAFEFVYLRGSPVYHLPSDDPASIHLGSVQHHGSHALALTLALGDRALDGLAGTDQQVFFSVMGRTTVHYPAAIGIVLATVAAVLLAVSIWLESRSGQTGIRRFGRGVGLLLAGVLGIAAAGAVAWRLAVAIRWTAEGPSAAEATVWMVALLVGVVGATAWMLRRVRSRIGERSTEWAGVALWWTMGAAASVAMPGTGYLFIWPVLATVTVMAVQPSSPAGRAVAGILITVVTVALALPVMEIFFQLAQPRPGNLDSQIPEVVAVTALLGALVVVLVAPYLRPGAPSAVTEVGSPPPER